MKPPPPTWLRPATVLTALLLPALAVLFLFDPSKADFYPRCIFHQLTGWNCAGCGGLRAVHALLHGDVAEALRFNPLVPFLVPILALDLVLPRRLPIHRPAVGWFLASLVVVFTVARNIPAYPFNMLGP